MDDATRSALSRSQVIDLTTTGRRTGERRRIEIFLHNMNGQLFISGMPFPGRTRSWIYNVAQDPHVTVHLKGETAAYIPATARVVNDPAERRPLIEAAAETWGRTDIDVMLEHSPLIEVTVEDYPRGGSSQPGGGLNPAHDPTHLPSAGSSIRELTSRGREPRLTPSSPRVNVQVLRLNPTPPYETCQSRSPASGLQASGPSARGDLVTGFGWPPSPVTDPLRTT